MAIQRVGWRPYATTQVVNAVDVDALAFISAAAITDLTQASAIATLVNDLKTYGLWTKMKALYPMVGGTATSHKFNLKDPRDLDAAYRLVFNGGWVHSSTGALPNGTTGYADTFFIPAASLTNNSSHLSYYSRTNRGFRNSYAMGSYQGSPTHNNIDLRFYGWGYNNTQNKTTSAQYDGWTGQDYADYTPTTTSCFVVASKTAVNLNKIYENGILKGTNTNTSTKSLPNVRTLIAAESSGPTNIIGYDNLESTFASIGDGLTDAEAANFYTSVQKFQTTLGRHVGTPYVSDPDAIAFLMAAGITDGTQATGINTLVITMKANGIWSKMKAIYPFVGGNATSHKFNLKDPRDLDAAYRLVFNGGWVHSSNGAKPNGTTGYADTKLAPNVMAQNSIHASFYSRTDITGSYWDLGAYNAGGGVVIGPRYQSGASLVYMNIKSADSMTDNNPTIGLYMGNRTSSTSNTLFRNGVIIVNGNKSSFAPISLNIYLGADNEGTILGYSPREQAFASIGDGLTDTEASNFYNSVQAYQTTLGRQVSIPVVSDTDAQSFLNAANITSFQQASAVNKLVVDLKSAGVWTKMKAIYPFVGGSATSHKFNLKDPRDLDAAYRLVFNGGWVHSSTGALPNGTTGYADTYLIPSVVISNVNSISISNYSRTQNTSFNGVQIGCYDGSNGQANELNIYQYYSIISRKGGSSYQYPIDAVLATETNTKGFQLNSRTSSSVFKLFFNNTLLNTNTTLRTANLPTRSLYIGASNWYNGVNQFTPHEHAFDSIGDGLTDVEATALYTAVQTYQTSLGRAVNTPVYNNGLVLNLDAGNANSYSGTGTTWFDLSSGNNGTLVNGPTYDATSGGSILFDGTNDYANFGNVQSLNSLTSGVTIGAWIKSSSTTTYSAILQKWYQSGMQGGFQLFISSGGILTLAIGDFITGYSGGSSTVSVITGSWVYVTATYDMNAIKIYINGVLNSTTSLVRSVVNSNNATLFLGQDDYGGRFFRGNISSATVHNRALTATEILSNFNSTRGRFGL